MRESRQRSADSIAEGFRASTGINVSTKTVQGNGMGFRSRAAACKPHITKSNAKRPMEQWKRVLWSDESHFSVWQSDG